MGKVIYGMLMSLDGYIANDKGEIDLPVPGPALHKVFNDQLRQTAISVVGRNMYEVMKYWDDEGEEHDAVGAEFAKLWRQTPKVVVSTTLKSVGPNATLLQGDLGAGIRALKAQYEDVIEVSGATLAASLTKLGLIDEYRMYLQPVVLGGGKPFFGPGAKPSLTFLGSEQLPEGAVLLRYGRAG